MGKTVQSQGYNYIGTSPANRSDSLDPIFGLHRGFGGKCAKDTMALGVLADNLGISTIWKPSRR